MKAKDILEKAATIVSNDRNASHGDLVETHKAIAAVWNGILDAAGKLEIPLDGHDVAMLMAGLKIARAYQGSYNEDDYTDLAGYAACAGQIMAERMR